MRIPIFTATCCTAPAAISTTLTWCGLLAGLGREVHWLCQDRTAPKLDGVTIHTPDIGRILPVYVAEYEGFEALPFLQPEEGHRARPVK